MGSLDVSRHGLNKVLRKGQLPFSAPVRSTASTRWSVRQAATQELRVGLAGKGSSHTVQVHRCSNGCRSWVLRSTVCAKQRRSHLSPARGAWR